MSHFSWHRGVLKFEDLTFNDQGVDVIIRRSKTDQTGKGVVLGVPFGSRKSTCPVLALQAWLAERGDAPGSLFGCSDQAVYRLVKRIAKLLGKAPDEFSAHSLRRGGITSMDQAGKRLGAIQARSRHKSVSVLLGYIEDKDRFDSMIGVGL